MFPKYVFPGKKNGTPTERLCWWVRELAGTANFWLDMHGGALTEILEPFIGSWVSGDKVIDGLVSRVITSISCDYASFENVPSFSKTKLLARMGCGYLLTESGELGKIESQAIERHTDWAHQVMSVLGMLDRKTGGYHKTLFSHIHEYVVQNDGLWRPHYSVCRQVKKGEPLGEVRSQIGAVLELVTAKENGMLLWGKVGLSARRGDVVIGVGYDPVAL
jgi:predicted deacylase